MGKIDNAISECSKAINIDSLCGDAYVSRADIYMKTRQKDNAIKDYKKSIILSPERYHTFYSYSNLAIFFEEENNLDSAIYYYSRAIELTKLHKYFLGNAMSYRRGKIFLKKGEDKNAFDDFKKSIELGFNFSDCFYQRALYKKMGDRKKYKADLKKSKSLKIEEDQKSKKVG